MEEYSSEKIFGIFSSLFGGRKSVYTLHGKTPAGKAFYRRSCNPARCGASESCRNCRSGSFTPLSPKAIENHINGSAAAGIYPADEKGGCRFALVELKSEDFRVQLRILAAVCANFEIPHLCEITDFGKGGRLWIFFEEPVPARKAAELAGSVIIGAWALTDAAPLSLLENIFPVPSKSGDFGKPVMLPLFSAEEGFSRFVSDDLKPIENIFELLENFCPENGLDVVVEPEGFPKRLDIEICNNLYVSREGLTRRAAAAICALARLPNPASGGEFLPSVPVFAQCFGFSAGRIHLPRGVLPRLFALVRPDSDINISDSRSSGERVNMKLVSPLSQWQRSAAEAALLRSFGVITAPVGRGKTKVVCAVMEKLQCSTLILVTEKSAAVRWRERLGEYLCVRAEEISCVISDKNYPNGKIDVAVLDGRTELRLAEYLPYYGLVVAADVDRLHCGPEIFRSVMEGICARRVYAVSTRPVEDTVYGEYVKMYCGDRIV